MFDVSIPNVHVDPLPSKGDIVTFSYEINTRHELPVNPEIIRVRSDVTWLDVVHSHDHATDQKFINGIQISYSNILFHINLLY